VIGGLQYLARYLDIPHERNARGTYALTRPQMNSVDERIRDTSQGAPTVDELAMICGVSERHLLRKFKQSTGFTVGGYIAHCRLMKAKNLLCRTDLSVKVIAFQLGFSAVGNFCTAFRKATGERPGEFRQHMRQTVIHTVESGEAPM
jgi:AraC family transcriptional regulator